MSKQRKNTMDQPSKAVIYCRVSSPKQVTEGHGLDSQETRCREYAKHKNYEVARVFHEEGITGKLLDRPQIQEMLAFLKQHKRQERHVVIIDDISRLARDIETHIALRASIQDAGGKLESPSIEFGDDSDSRLVEHLLASVAAHQREKNTEQGKNRMRARMMNGYWVFPPPPGYRYEKKDGHGKILVPDEPVASIIAEALNGYASGRFETQGEVKQFLDAQVNFPKGRDGEVHFQRIADLFSRVIYTGYIDCAIWDIHLQPGKHEPLISYETFQKIQHRLHETGKAPARKDLRFDFPLRGFVTCGCCGTPMTSGWSTGRNQKYPYYLCRQKGCEQYGKSVRKEVIEGEFEALLLELQPTPDLFYMAMEMFKELWDEREQGAKEKSLTIQSELHLIDRKVDQFLDRVVEADTPLLIETYEKKIRGLQAQKVEMSEKIRNCGRPLKGFDESFRTAFDFLGNPHKLWSSDRLEDKRAVMRLAFEAKLPYYRNEGFRTAQTSLPFRLLEDLKEGKSGMVRETGIEPVCPRGRRILSPVRLPIPPLPHSGRHFTIAVTDRQERRGQGRCIFEED
jgi:site-specific DNA recombinase